MKTTAPILVALALCVSTPALAKDLRILVSGIEAAKGEIDCLLFSEEKGFPDNVDRAFTRVQYPAVEGMLTCTFSEVPPGRYAVAVVHDENGNREIDTNLLGFSKEPWGVTNNVRPERRSPKFHEAVIYVGPSQPSDHEVVVQR